MVARGKLSIHTTNEVETMTYYEQDGKVFLTGCDSFDIEQTLESGQCFRFGRLGAGNYTLVAHGKVLHIEQKGEEICFSPCTLSEFELIWHNYFDLGRDYDEVRAILSKGDKVMAEAVKFAPGIRMMNQDVWECLVSFIISANNRIPMIKQVVKNISDKFGDEIPSENVYTGHPSVEYTFPTYTQLVNATADDFAACKAGFRGKYIVDAIQKVNSGQIKLDGFSALSTEELKNELMSIKGVGVKVADCVLLFSCKRREIFPIDVWIRRVVQELYFGGREVPLNDLQAFASDKWGEHAGYANQFLFHYARLHKIGTKSEVKA